MTSAWRTASPPYRISICNVNERLCIRRCKAIAINVNFFHFLFLSFWIVIQFPEQENNEQDLLSWYQISRTIVLELFRLRHIGSPPWNWHTKIKRRTRSSQYESRKIDTEFLILFTSPNPIENASAIKLPMPTITIWAAEISAPTQPAITANIVTMPSSPASNYFEAAIWAMTIQTDWTVDQSAVWR